MECTLIIDLISHLLCSWFSLGTLVSSTNKTYHHDITEILLKVALNIITLPLSLKQIPHRTNNSSDAVNISLPEYSSMHTRFHFEVTIERSDCE